LVVRSTKVQSEQLQAADNLAVIIRAGAGTNTIDVTQASDRGVYVANCPGKNAVAVAELTMGHLINCDRRLADNVQHLREQKWAKKKFSNARGLSGRTLAVLGTGRIGQEVISRALAFGMNIQAWSRSLTPQKAAALGVNFAATPIEAARDADALTVHLALTDETKNIVSTEVLSAVKAGAYIINTSRGEMVDEKALMDAIETRKLRAGLDVFANEPGAGDAEFNSPLAQEANVYGTHHIGASTDQASEAVGDEVFRIIRTFRQEGWVPNCVNIAESTPATHALIVRHVDKVGVLANLLNQLKEEGINVQQMENIIFKGAAACARIQLATPPSAASLSTIDSNPDVFSTSLVNLENS
jgi:D-3-phosphoglycerate dehydrogenase